MLHVVQPAPVSRKQASGVLVSDTELSWVTLCLDICLGVMICLAIPLKHCLNFKELCWGLVTGDKEWILFLRTFPFSPYLGILHCLLMFVHVFVCGEGMRVSLHMRSEGGFRSLCSSCGLWGLDSSVRLGGKCLQSLSHLLVPSSRDSSWILSHMISFTGDVAVEQLTHQVYEVLWIL